MTFAKHALRNSMKGSHSAGFLYFVRLFCSPFNFFIQVMRINERRQYLLHEIAVITFSTHVYFIGLFLINFHTTGLLMYCLVPILLRNLFLMIILYGHAWIWVHIGLHLLLLKNNWLDVCYLCKNKRRLVSPLCLLLLWCLSKIDQSLIKDEFNGWEWKEGKHFCLSTEIRYSIIGNIRSRYIFTNTYSYIQYG